MSTTKTRVRLASEAQPDRWVEVTLSARVPGHRDASLSREGNGDTIAYAPGVAVEVEPADEEGRFRSVGALPRRLARRLSEGRQADDRRDDRPGEACEGEELPLRAADGAGAGFLRRHSSLYGFEGGVAP